MLTMLLLLLFALMINSTLTGVVSRVSSESVLVLIARPTAFWFLTGDCPDAVWLWCGEDAAELQTGDIVLAHAIGAVAQSDPPKTGTKFIWRIGRWGVDA